MNVLELSSRDLLNHAQDGFESALAGLKVKGLVNWNEVGCAEPSSLDGEFLRSLDHDTRRAVFDKLHDIGMLPVYEGNRPEERDAGHKAIATEVRDAKWRYMLALANDAYDIGLDYVDLEVLSPMFRQLALVERGATNRHMPTTHKLRHNPSIHSLHVAGLIYDSLSEAEQNGELNGADKAELSGIKTQLMRSALVHDMGELKGELSVAKDRGRMTAEQLEAFETNRGHSETEIFTQGLDQRLGSLEKVLWPKPLLATKREKLLHDYEIAEDADQFLGRAHKVFERIQSQHDYLRFEGKDFAPPLSTIPQGEDDHRMFMFNYAISPFAGESQGEKTGPSLSDMAKEFGNPKVAKTIYSALTDQIRLLQRAVSKALDYTPEGFVDRVKKEAAEAPQQGAAR